MRSGGDPRSGDRVGGALPRAVTTIPRESTRALRNGVGGTPGASASVGGGGAWASPTECERRPRGAEARVARTCTDLSKKELEMDAMSMIYKLAPTIIEPIVIPSSTLVAGE